MVKGAKVTHEHGSHDDHINAVALCANVILDSNQKRGGWFFASVNGGSGVYSGDDLIISDRY